MSERYVVRCGRCLGRGVEPDSGWRVPIIGVMIWPEECPACGGNGEFSISRNNVIVKRLLEGTCDDGIEIEAVLWGVSDLRRLPRVYRR